MIKEKYKQLFLPLQFGGIRTITIHNRCATYFSIIFSQLRNFVEELKKNE